MTAAGDLKAHSGADVHLVVLQHGLWGNPKHLRVVREHIEAHLQLRGSKDSIVFVNSDVNVGYLTYDGVDVCGDRLVQLILDQGPVAKLSLIGYSLGGLMCRYAAGKLLALGYFEETEPMNFVTIATPHLGSWRSPESWTNRAFNAVVPLAISRTGHQVMLKDEHWHGQPLLALMAHPRHAFHRALGRFRKLMALASVEYDRTVPYCTAAVRLDNPYAGASFVEVDEKYPSVVRPAGKAADRPSRFSYGGKTHYLVRFLLSPLLTPLMIPYLVYFVLSGVRHFSNSKQTKRDMAWLDSYFHGKAEREGSGAMPPMGQLGQQQQQQQEQQHEEQQEQQQRQQLRSQQQAGQAEGAEQRPLLYQQQLQQPDEQPSSSRYNLRRRPTSSRPGPSAFATAAAQQAPPSFHTAATSHVPRRLSSGLSMEDVDDDMLMGGSDDGDVPPTLPLSPQGSGLHETQPLLERDGIVEMPAAVHHLQEWIIEHLNKDLQWQRVDVVLRHFHAHAAIVIRDEKRFKHTGRDHLTYVADQFEL